MESHPTQTRIQKSAEALDKYFKSDGSRSLLVNGAPGTGKTWFCKDYLKRVLASRKNTISKLRWRYFTVNTHLADHFDSVLQDFTAKDAFFKKDLEACEDGQSVPIRRLFKELMPTIHLDKRWDDTRGVGLLTFSIFKQKIREFYGQKSVKHSGIKCPPIAYAWILYNQIIHDPVTGEKINDMDVEKFKELNKDSVFELKPKEVSTFLKFHNEELNNKWYTYSYASHQSRIVFESLKQNEKERFMIDILIVDEVQDISAPVMALLLELMRPDFQSHSIMIAGDTVQTVNRSGFGWIDFSLRTAKSLENSTHKNRTTLVNFGVCDESELVRFRTTLRQVWRNGVRLIEFNNHMRKNYASNFGLSELYSSKFDYPASDIEETEESNRKDEDSMIVVYEAKQSEYDDLIEQLAIASGDLAGQNIALITPFELSLNESETLNNKIGNVYFHDAESVKGLEFDSIVVLMPYLVEEEEARSSIKRNIGDDESTIEAQIQTWSDSWKSGGNDASSKNFENFNQLFLNIMTRMNVLFSRPEKRILIISPIEFGQSVKLYQHSPSTPKMISFGSPSIPYESVKIEDNSLVNMLDVLTVGDKSVSGELNVLIRDTLAKSSLNDDGTQVQNERRSWDNLWYNIQNDVDAPRKSIAYASGIEYEDSIDILKLLRSDLGRNSEVRFEGKSIRDKENQLVNAILTGEAPRRCMLL